jgi:hypothetical protein
VINLNGQNILLALKRMPTIGALSLRILVWSPTLIGLKFPLTTVVGITSKRKQFLTCTQKTTRAKLERLHSARHIKGDQRSPLDMQTRVITHKPTSITLSTMKHAN